MPSSSGNASITTQHSEAPIFGCFRKCAGAGSGRMSERTSNRLGDVTLLVTVTSQSAVTAAWIIPFRWLTKALSIVQSCREITKDDPNTILVFPPRKLCLNLALPQTRIVFGSPCVISLQLAGRQDHPHNLHGEFLGRLLPPLPGRRAQSWDQHGLLRVLDGHAWASRFWCAA